MTDSISFRILYEFGEREEKKGREREREREERERKKNWRSMQLDKWKRLLHIYPHIYFIYYWKRKVGAPTFFENATGQQLTLLLYQYIFFINRNYSLIDLLLEAWIGSICLILILDCANSTNIMYETLCFVSCIHSCE